MRKLKGYKALTEDQQDLFERVYARHMSGFGTERRQMYEGQLREVKWDAKLRCLKVYYKNGDWWHYCLDGTWY